MKNRDTLAPGARGNCSGSEGRRDARMAKAFHVLSVGPVERGCVIYDALLSGPNFRLTIATDYREVWKIADLESLQVVILHSTLSPLELEDTSRFIRRKWPHARILVIRAGEEFLDDPLYDDHLAPAVAPEVLLTAIERLAGGWHHLKPETLNPGAGIAERTGTAAAGSS